LMVWAGLGIAVALAVAALVLGTAVTRSDVGEQIAQRTAAAYHALPPEQRNRTAVVGESYIVAAYIDGFSDEYALPKAYSPNRSYAYFPHPAEEQDAVLYVGSNPNRLRPYFLDVREVGDVTGDMHSWLFTGRREAWGDVWPRLRTLSVA
jgi:hypothetical protein